MCGRVAKRKEKSITAIAVANRHIRDAQIRMNAHYTSFHTFLVNTLKTFTDPRTHTQRKNRFTMKSICAERMENVSLK